MTTIITGTSQGLGKELARQYEQASPLILLNRTKTGHPHEIIVDFASEASVKEATSSLRTRLGATKEVFFILNAAVYGSDEKLADVTPADLGTLLYTNVFSQLSIVENLLENGVRVRLIAISSNMASISLAADPTHFAYSGSKAALNLCIRLLRRAHPQLNYLIIDPGWMKTRMGGDDAPDDPQQVAENIVGAAQDEHNWNLPDGMFEANTRRIVGW